MNLKTTVRVHKVNGLVTLQDPGRFGYLRQGVPIGGWMDDLAARTANTLVGNLTGVPVLEAFLGQLILETDGPLMLGIAGGSATIRIGDKPAPMDSRIEVSGPERIEIRKAQGGSISYIAFAGGPACIPVLGSCATYLPAHLGGFDGRGLQRGDSFIVRSRERLPEPPPSTRTSKRFHRSLVVHIVPGPEFDLFSKSDQEAFTTNSYRLTSSLNRMGYRMEGTPLGSGTGIRPSAILKGTIQVPPDGQPIALMADCQVTGGYPRIAQIVAEDIGRLAQMTPGSRIRFRIADDSLT